MQSPSIIQFKVTEAQQVNISIIDSMGRTIKEVLSEFMCAGMHQITIELPDLSKSIYFLIIRKQDENQLIRLNEN